MSTRDAADPTSDFFGELGARGQEQMLARVSGTLRIDLTNDGEVDHWYITIKKGNVHVGRRNAAADASVTAQKALFDGMVTGRVNAMAALLRNLMRVEGDLGLLISLQRLFPGPEPVRPVQPGGGQAGREGS
jgi:putative sterol carrier protein